MRLDDYRESENVGDQRGMSFGGGGGGLAPLAFMIGSRFGIGGIIVVAIGLMLFGMNPLSLIGGGTGAPQQTRTSGASASQACAVNPESTFSCRVLASTEDTWSRIFQESGQRYDAPRLIFYEGTGQSGCGVAQSAMGPFYCPSDNNVFLDTGFFREMSSRLGAGGDFAQAYVVAHEVGHHIQFLTGVADRVRAAQSRASSAESNAIQVRMELQADCYAGVWAGRNRNRIEPGDVEEGMRAAEAIGDDTLQRSAQGRVSPESFTHGTSAQRMAWLRRGLQTADPAQCDTFAEGVEL